ncbi:MAG: hypothetical protein ACYDA1_01740 [Vulcanimicrobiaceae bacterium]
MSTSLDFAERCRNTVYESEPLRHNKGIAVLKPTRHFAYFMLCFFIACGPTAHPAPHATASPDPCKRTPKAQVICASANFFKAKTFTATLDGGSVFHGTITMIRPSAYSYRFINPSTGGEIISEGVVIGSKSWVKGNVTSGFMDHILQSGAVLSLRGLRHDEARSSIRAMSLSVASLYDGIIFLYADNPILLTSTPDITCCDA